MRVLQIVADGRPGGGTSVVLDLCRGIQARHGHDVVLASAPGSYALEAAAGLGLKTYALDLWRSRLDLAVPAEVRRLVDEVRPDTVHAHGGRAGLALARARTPVRFAYTVHGYHFLGKSWPVRMAAALAERRIGRQAGAVVWASAADRALAGHWRLDPGRPLDQVIRNGIDLSSLPWPVPKTPRLIAFLGRLSPEKNPGLVIEMLARPELDGCTLVMIGGGPLEASLRTRCAALGIEGRVRITGALPREQALAELGRASVLVLPSLWESIPVALAEAMAMGVPVVASAVRGVPELVEREVSGLLRTNPHDIAGFAHDTCRILADPSLAGRLIEGGRSAVERVYQLDRMVDDHDRLYRQLCNRATDALL